ncbi:hypothetical protein ABN702_06415 [Bacillus haimaensis]|uniref:hypothetical protein n=1 Tax=Bacillus haimaensis TaxID=3160967 RepID=UPI003AA8798A
MRNIKNSYRWLFFTFASTLISMTFFHWLATIAVFIAGMILTSISIFEEFIREGQ